MIAVFGFDYSTIMAQPWADAGITCYCVDLRHQSGEARDGNIIKVGCNIFDCTPPSDALCAFSFWFPPCTDVATSGARWMKDKGLGAIIRALQLFQRSVELAEALGAPYGIENPRSTISSHWRKADYTFHPHEYAGYAGGEDDLYTKKTCLWAGNNFTMPEKRSLPPTQGSKMHLMWPGEERASLRSMTPKGFARAVFEANFDRARCFAVKRAAI